MRHISFGWTTAPLVMNEKRVTRREWDHEYAVRFMAEDYVAADDKQARFGGKQVAVLRLTVTPYYSGELPEEDFALEGFEFCRRHNLTINKIRPDVLWRAWRIDAAKGKRFWIVRFEPVEFTAYGREFAKPFEEAEARMAQEVRLL